MRRVVCKRFALRVKPDLALVALRFMARACCQLAGADWEPVVRCGHMQGESRSGCSNDGD